MRQQNCIALALVICSALALECKAQTKCQQVALRSYKDNKCLIEVPREQPGNLLPIQVPGDTVVEVHVTDPHPQETLTVTAQTDEVATPDFGAAFVKQILDPLKSLVFSEQKRTIIEAQPPDSILKEQKAIAKKFADVIVQVYKATVELSCLQSYQAVTTQTVNAKAVYSCGPAMLTSATFPGARDNALNDISAAANSPIPVASLKAVDAEITAAQADCFILPNDAANKDLRVACLARLDTLQSNQIRLSDSNTNVQSARKTLLLAYDAINNLPQVSNPFVYTISRTANRKATLKVKATGLLVDKTSTDVATIVITWQKSNFVLSTGMLVSGLANQSFANSPIYVNGVPQTDSSGKVLTVVTIDSIKPAVVFPVVLGSYRLFSAQHWNGKASILISGGAGANLTSKTTDFAAGLSLQLRSIMLSPVAHFGRQTELINGVYVGEQLGSSPPALPTRGFWEVKAGFAITYTLPIP